MLALDLNPTDPLLTRTQEETKVAAKTKLGNQERHFHDSPAARLTQDLPTPFSLPH